MKKVGFIGAGNMATAIVKGIASGKMSNDIELFVYDIDLKKAKDLSDIANGVVCDSIADLVKQSDYIFLAVKPQNIDDVLKDACNSINKNAVIVSILAGMTAKYIKDYLGYDAKVIPVMPNTPLLLGCGAVAMAKVSPVSDTEYGFVKNIFAASGDVADVGEDKMKEIIAINGSSPAFIYLFSKYFVDYAKSENIDENTALDLFCKSLEGSAKMMKESGYTIDELIKMVSSPGGTTLAGLQEFYDADLENTVKSACKSCTKRAYELSK